MIPHKKDLMTRMLKRAARARREHGIALLFTLCILSMALVTAMIFSSNASTSRKVASTYVDTSAARILADGVVSRAILALMQSDNASYVCSNYNTNKPNGNADEYASDWIWKLEKKDLFSFNDGPLRFNRTTYYNRDDSRCPSWEYVYDKVYGDATERIFGRYAYVAIGQNDQLNPNAIGKRNYPDFDLTTFQKRLGRWTCEPQFNFKSTRNHWDYSEIISPETIRDKYAMPDGWVDEDLFIDDLTGGNSNQDKQLKMMADQYFDVSGQGEYNKFNPNGKTVGDLSKYETTNGDQFRFPLIRNDWDSISVATVKGAVPWFGPNQTFVNQTVANLINYNASINRPPVTDNENWITGEPTYTGNKRTPYINEVHADVSVGGNLGVRMQERYLADPNDPSSWKWRVWYTNCTYSHEITLNVETVNMYPTTGGSNGALAVGNPLLVGEISYEHWNENGDNAGSWSTETVRFDAGTQWTVVASGNDAGYKFYTFMLDNGSVGSMTTQKLSNYDRPMGHEPDFYKFVKVRNVKVSLERVVLRDTAGRNADLSLMPVALRNGRSFLTRSVGEQVAGESRHFYLDTQANDPRQNLNRTDWSTPKFSEKETEVGETVGFANNVITLGQYHDNENRTEPAYAGNDSISTAYIRHGQMQSLWELGAVHRGAAWQTINLKCAAAKGVRMEGYQNGDGHLLDQVALARSTERADDYVIGMINLNCVATFGGSSAPFAFKSLFTNFPVYRSYAAMNDGRAAGGVIGGDSIDSDKTGNMDADAYAKDLSEGVTYAISQGSFLRRTAVFPSSYPSSQMEKLIPANVPDAQAEEIFSRVVNLLKWNKQQTKRATVLVLAQTIKDVGGASLEKVLSDDDVDVMRDAGFQSFESTAKNTAASSMTAGKVRSTFRKRGVAFKQYDNFYDEITGEAKLIVRLEWDESANDNNGAWKITRKEYAE